MTIGGGLHRRVEHRGHVGQQGRVIADTPALAPLVGLGELIRTRRHDHGRLHLIEARLVLGDAIRDPEAGKLGEDRIDLRLVAVLDGSRLRPTSQAAGGRRHVVHPVDEHPIRVTRRDHHRGPQCRPVEETNTGDGTVVDDQFSDARITADRASRRLQAGPHGVGERTAPPCRPSGPDHVSGGVGGGGEPGPRRVGVHTPDGRTGADRRHRHMPIVEVLREHGGCTAAAPVEESDRTARPSARHPTEQASGRGGCPRHLDRQFGDRQRVVKIAAVSLDLLRVRRRESVEHAVDVVEMAPRLGVVVEEMEDAGLRLQVAEPVGGQVELVDDGHRADHRVVAVADVEARAEIGHRRRAAADRGSRLDQQRVDPGPGEIRRADQAVVATADDDDVRRLHQNGLSPIRLRSEISSPRWL